MNKVFKDVTMHRLLIFLIVILLAVIVLELQYFMSGFLGAIVLYSVFRRLYRRLIERRKWNKFLATFFIFFLIIIGFALPIWMILEFLIPQINALIQSPEQITQKFQPVVNYIQNNEMIQKLDFKISNQQIMEIINRVMVFVPSTLGWVGQFITNCVVALFILYFMLMNSQKMERFVKEILPFSIEGKRYFIKQNKDLIKSNAYGIPILAISQGVIAIIGYWIFGVDKAIFWGLMTGVASVIPMVGTMLIWVPICIYQLATGDVHNALLLAIYSLVLVGSIDNVLRFTLLKRMADVHPLVTVFGVILGVQLFGIMGLVFGPLLFSLPGILYNVFKIERRNQFLLHKKKDQNIIILDYNENEEE